MNRYSWITNKYFVLIQEHGRDIELPTSSFNNGGSPTAPPIEDKTDMPPAYGELFPER